MCVWHYLLEHSGCEDHSDFYMKWSLFFHNIDPKDPDKRECYWRHLTRTVTPDGLNFEDNFFLSFLVNFFLDKIFTLTKNFLCKYWDQIYWKMIYYFSRKLFFCLFSNKFFSSFDVIQLPFCSTSSARIYPP